MIFIIALVLTGLYLSTSITNLILTAKKKNNITKITNFFPTPLLIAATIMFLIMTFPDSKNIIRYYSCALLTTSISYFFYLYKIIKSEKASNIITTILMILSNILWLEILIPSFKLCPIPTFVLILIIISFIALIVFYYFYCTKEFNFLNFATTFLLFASEAALLLASIITIISQIAIYSFMYLFGISLLVFITCKRQKLFLTNKNNESPFYLSLLFAIYNLVMSASAILMQI